MKKINYPIDNQLSIEQLDFIENSLKNSFKIKEFKATENELTIQLDNKESTDAIKKLLKKYLFISKSMHKDLLFYNDITITYVDDPQPALQQSRDVIPIQPGFYTLQGDFLRVFHALNQKIKSIALALNAIEQEYPALWPVRLFKKIDYFKEFPQQVILCAPVRNDYQSRKQFAEKYGKEENFESIAMDELIANAEFGLEPAVCDCCYYGLEGSTNLGNAFYTCYNKVFRNERSATDQLDRMTNFSVRDIMFVGSEEFVLEGRQKLIEILSQFIIDLSLHAKIETANDPFFANESAMKSVFQNAERLKYELLAYIPHLDRDIAVGSINFHRDFFGKAFDIQLAIGQPAYSGCIGIGMERLTYALYCQHGPSLQSWPQSLLDFLKIDFS
jgi:seryl-tRNA synthetase